MLSHVTELLKIQMRMIIDYAKNGDLHNNLSKNFKEITWQNKIYSLYQISLG